jgi:hypothetical protein
MKVSLECITNASDTYVCVRARTSTHGAQRDRERETGVWMHMAQVYARECARVCLQERRNGAHEEVCECLANVRLSVLEGTEVERL